MNGLIFLFLLIKIIGLKPTNDKNCQYKEPLRSMLSICQTNKIRSLLY